MLLYMTQEMTTRRAAGTYPVPKSTLADRVSGRVKPGQLLHSKVYNIILRYSKSTFWSTVYIDLGGCQDP